MKRSLTVIIIMVMIEWFVYSCKRIDKKVDDFFDYWDNLK